MKQQINRILSVCLALVLCVGFWGILTPPVFAESGTCGENLTWKLENGTLTISGTGQMEKFHGTNNPAPWARYGQQIQCVKINEGITTVGDAAFYDMPRLSAVTLPKTVRSIGELAFANCSKLTQISLPAIEKIGWGAFYSCSSLSAVMLPSTLQVIEDQAFYMCSGLAGITIPASVTDFGERAFSFCTNLVYVNIEAPITVLPYRAFYGCDILWEVYLPNSVQTVEDDAFGECPDLYYVECKGSAEAVAEIEKQLQQDTIRESSGNDTSYIKTDSAHVVTTTKEQKNEQTGEVGQSTTVNATVTDADGWQSVTEVVNKTIQNGKKPDVEIQIQGDPKIPEGALNDLADREVVVNIHTSQNVDWQVIVRDQNTDTLKGSQDFSVSMSKNDQGKYTDVIGAAESYTVTLGNTTLNSTVLFPLGVDTARKVATLYVVDGAELRKLSSVIVDDDGKAAFHVAGTEAGEYVVALNVQNIPQEEVRVPQKLASEYDITYGATLMDAYGNQYVLTGRVNKLGFGIGTLTLIVVGVLVGTGVLVGVIMTIWNKQNQKFAKQKHTKKKL